MITRRALVVGFGCMPCIGWSTAALRVPDELMTRLIGDRPVAYQGILIDMPRLAETGNSVSITVSVDSPMTDADHVRRIHIILPGNPEPLAVSFHLSPLNGLARVSTRLRLARTQTVRVLAEHEGGRVTGAELPVLVTLGACIDELWTS